jgi:energy-coupling factor transporter ATP-binding protein EcfA2
MCPGDRRMNAAAAIRDNPFATRYVRPGCIGYRFPAGQDAAQLIIRLRRQKWWGEIVGPHGSGKSTLVETLDSELQRVGRHVVMLRFRGGQGHRMRATPTDPPWSTATQVIADGYEQLGWLGRARLRRAARHAGAGLIVTAHAPTGLPTLLHTAPDLDAVQAMVHTLLGGELCVIRDHDIAASFARHRGNVREVLFDLYDLYERRRTG